jgi:hypothetical protein
MRAIAKFVPGFIVTAGLLTISGVLPAQQPPADTGNGAQRMRGGMGSFGPGARGILGTVTEVTPEHYMVKTDTGDLYTVHYSVNTRIMKQPAGARIPGQRNSGESRRSVDRSAEVDPSDVERAIPQNIKPTEIKVGDVITAGGEVDTPNKSIGAVAIFQLDPERAKQMREMQANYGKTWLAGRITAIDGTRITIEGMVDHTPHAIDVDENTSFRQRRDSITLADIKPGEQLRAEGAVKNGVFLATTVNAMIPREAGDDGPPRPKAGPALRPPNQPAPQ